ncbi:hypothetical protein PN462_21660 [Spirulina sp. CS-785/01]|uniref:hypothetical protein n=1 Tax=Spirulina sp. CS-785/01 TaxID=3021716 RepID=UPI00232C4097|nr:hypothetical protein [Spirulina sp. CS-785/01]MDB9315736.1 hypothetical protein [Spirulina sp. CS-785/01]
MQTLNPVKSCPINPPSMGDLPSFASSPNSPSPAVKPMIKVASEVVMLSHKIKLVEQLYEIYSESMLSGQIADRDFELVQWLQNIVDRNQEHREMVRRILYAVKVHRIEVLGAEAQVPCYSVA